MRHLLEKLYKIDQPSFLLRRQHSQALFAQPMESKGYRHFRACLKTRQIDSSNRIKPYRSDLDDRGTARLMAMNDIKAQAGYPKTETEWQSSLEREPSTRAWVANGLTALSHCKQVVKQEQENRQHSNFTCLYVRTNWSMVKTAGLYSTHAETADQKSDGQIWISKTRGLPLRQEMDIDTGGKARKNHNSMRYEYGNVQPPQP